MLISIVIPTLNVARIITPCLESLRRQTFADFEIIVMDGGSTDETLELVGNHDSHFGTRLLVNSGKDTGIYDAMNHGIARAKGEWLYFLGADDALHTADTLQRVADFIREQPDSDVVYGNVRFRSNGQHYDSAFDLDKLLFEKNICHQAVFYRRTVFEKLGTFNLRYRIWADWDMNIRCFSHPALKLRHMDIVVADYEDTAGISSLAEDEEMKKRLPVFLLNEANRKIRQSKEYRIGVRVRSWLPRFLRSKPQH